jgi:anti-anti-sigma regulatory factor
MRMHTRADETLGLVMVALRGQSSPGTAEALRRVLDSALAVASTRVLVDLLDLDDVDPATALVLLEYDERFSAAGGWLWLVHGAGPAGSSLRFMGVHDRVPSSPSREAAGWPGG